MKVGVPAVNGVDRLRTSVGVAKAVLHSFHVRVTRAALYWKGRRPWKRKMGFERRRRRLADLARSRRRSGASGDHPFREPSSPARRSGPPVGAGRPIFGQPHARPLRPRVPRAVERRLAGGARRGKPLAQSDPSRRLRKPCRRSRVESDWCKPPAFSERRRIFMPS